MRYLPFLLLISPQFALLCTIFAPSKLVSIQFIVRCFFNNIWLDSYATHALVVVTILPVGKFISLVSTRNQKGDLRAQFDSISIFKVRFFFFGAVRKLSTIVRWRQISLLLRVDVTVILVSRPCFGVSSYPNNQCYRDTQNTDPAVWPQTGESEVIVAL